MNRHLKTHQNNNNNVNINDNITFTIDTQESGKTTQESGKTTQESGKTTQESGKMEPKSINNTHKSGKEDLTDTVSLNLETYECDKCYKTFMHNRSLKRHQKLYCKQILNPCECCNCHRKFESKQAVYDHKRRDNCKSKALVPIDTNNCMDIVPDKIGTGVKTVVNNNMIDTVQTMNNTIVGRDQNTQNNNITINVFPSSLSSEYNINTDHINLKELRKTIRDQSVFEAVGTSLRKVLENSDNLPVKKKNIKSDYSYIHVGNNQWEMRNDSEIYGLISYHISRCTQEYLDGTNLNQLKTYYREATEALEFVATDNIEDLEKAYIKKARRIMDVILISAYDKNTVDVAELLD